MADRGRYVSRREFYSAVGLVYNMIGLIALQITPGDDKPVKSILVLFIALAAIVTGLIYVVTALRYKEPPREP